MLAIFLFVDKNLESSLSISESHDIFVVVKELLLKIVSLVYGLLKRSLELLHLFFKMLNRDFVLLNLTSNIDELLSVHSNELKILSGDIIVVLFHFLESQLMVHHQFVDMLVLSFFNLVNFNFHSQFELLSENFHFFLIFLNEHDSLLVKTTLEVLVVAIKSRDHTLNVTYVCALITYI